MCTEHSVKRKKKEVYTQQQQEHCVKEGKKKHKEKAEGKKIGGEKYKTRQ